MFTYHESEIILDCHLLNRLAQKHNIYNGWKADTFPLETHSSTISIKPEHNNFMSYSQNYNYATKSSDKTQSNKLYQFRRYL
jgi:hypothetical protein